MAGKVKAALSTSKEIFGKLVAAFKKAKKRIPTKKELAALRDKAKRKAIRPKMIAKANIGKVTVAAGAAGVVAGKSSRKKKDK